MNLISHFSKSDEICCVAIGLEPEGHTHCGILYNSEKGSFFTHLGGPLAFHNQTKWDNEIRGYMSTSPQYKWLPFNKVHPAKLILIRTKCIAISKKNRKLPFGIYFDNKTEFDAVGNLIFGKKDSTGLTCASFVRIVLRSSGVNLIDETGWPTDRESDEIWRKNLIRLDETRLVDLKQKISEIEQIIRTTNNLTFQHIKKFEKTTVSIDIETLENTIKGLKLGTIRHFMRFRPEEVAGVSYKDYKDMPFKYEYSDSDRDGAKKIGEELLQYLKTDTLML